MTATTLRTLRYTLRVHAENLVRRCAPAMRDASLWQLLLRPQQRDFSWFPAHAVCHDILGRTAWVDLAAGGGPRQAMRLGHPSATLRVGAEALQVDGQWRVAKALMGRSARILMEGWVRVPADCA